MPWKTPDCTGNLCVSPAGTSTASSFPSQQICVRSLSWAGTPPGLGILATWDLRRMPSMQAQLQPQPQVALSPHLVGAWSAGIIDPRSWGFGSDPTNEYVVRTRASRLRTLRRIIAGLPDAVSFMRPAIWPAEYGDEHSGIRHLESRWAAAWDHRQQIQPLPDEPGQSRTRPIHSRPMDASLSALSSSSSRQTPNSAAHCSTGPAGRAYAQTARMCSLAQR